MMSNHGNFRSFGWGMVLTTLLASAGRSTAFRSLSTRMVHRHRVLAAAAPFFSSTDRHQRRKASCNALLSSSSSRSARKPRAAAFPGSRLFQTATADVDATTGSIHTKEELEKAMQVTHPAYDVVFQEVVDEYGAYCTLYRHKATGAEILSVSNDDDNKVFGITFRTPPNDSTGVPHILEHSVLCGSRKYTTKDPFVGMLQSSLQTFLNAFTYPDRTCYVVASQNTQDFYNLVNVYFDAVLHPRAINDPNVHAQEGWHLELTTKNEPLTYKGVVYNEMKGVYSSPDSLLARTSQRSLFPDVTCYNVDSGGDPNVIPELSFDQFAAFHAEYYHPANSRIYFSGDDDVTKRLELADEYLTEFALSQDESQAKRKASKIPWQSKAFKEPLYQHDYYPVAAEQEADTADVPKHMVQMNWLLHDKPLSAVDELTMEVLDHLLLGTPSSSLRKALMESGLGEAMTGGGLSDTLLQSTFSLGLKGVAKEDVSKVEQVILETLNKLADEGFADDDIAASMNTIEFDMREFNTGSFPKGLSFMLRSMSKWLFDESPTDALRFEKPLAELKDSIAKSGSKVFQDMITKMLLSNNHRSTVEMIPSPTLEAEQLKDEQDRLAAIKDSMSDDDLENVIQQTQELQALQAAEDSPEARATLPTLSLKDIKREVTEYPIAVSENENDSGVTVLRHELGSTAGIAYVTWGLDMSSLDLEKDVPLLPLFTRIIMESGAGDYDAVALTRQIGSHTGGIQAYTMTSSVHPKTGDHDAEGVVGTGEYMMTKLMLRGKATRDKTAELFRLFGLIMTKANIKDSQSKVVEILKERKSRLESSVQGSGHSVANMRMMAKLRPAAYIDEVLNGSISQLETTKELLQQAQDDWPSLLQRLEDIRAKLLSETCRHNMILDITADAKVLEKIQPSVDDFLKTLPGNAEASTSSLFDPYAEKHPWVAKARDGMLRLAKDEGFVVPTQVSYVGKTGMVFAPGEKVSGSAAVVSRFLRTGYLWDRVRVMGGAYGGFCVFRPFSGMISFLSYRDPNFSKTLEVYDKAAQSLLDASLDDETLTQAIIGTIGDMDGALSPDQKGDLALQRWLMNESPEYRQTYRDEVLSTKASDFVDFAKRLQSMKEPTVAVVSSKAAFAQAAEEGHDYLTLTEVM